MSIFEALSIITEFVTDNSQLITAISVMVLFFVEFNKKIKFNPITAICSYVGKACSKDLREQITKLEKRFDKGNSEHYKCNKDLLERIDAIENKLDIHIQESVEKDMRDRRIAILNFSNSILNGRNHTKEEYEYLISVCDRYEIDCENKKIINSVAEESIKLIKETYSSKLKHNDFL